MTVEIDQSNFDQRLAEKEAAVVMFYRLNCGHSQNMEPIFTELSSEMSQVAFFKVSTPANLQLVDRFGIKGTPTFIVFRQGSVVSAHSGEMTKEALRIEAERAAS